MRPTLLSCGSLALAFVLTAGGQIGSAAQTVVVVLDDSGSMDQAMRNGQRRIAVARKSLESVLSQLPPETEFGLLTLNSSVNSDHWLVPLGPVDRANWRPVLSEIRAKGGTPLGASVREGANQLLKRRSSDPYATYRLLVVTDGEANDKELLDSLLPDLLSRGISLDVIGVDMAEDHSLARSAHTYRRAGDEASLTQALSEVFAETATDSQAAESDFELLAGLSDDAAAEIVKSLSAVSNEPLATSEVPVELGPSAHAASSGGRPLFAKTFLGTLCCVGSLGAIVFVAAILFGASVNAKRRR